MKNKLFDFGEIKPAEIQKEGYRVADLDKRLQPVYLSGPEHRGKECSMFAYFGIPDTGKEKYPAILLIHGGDGRAYEFWATKWLDMGFAVLTVDNNSRHVTEEGVVHNPAGGPKAWEPWNEDLMNPADTWSYVSVKALLMAEEMLAAHPSVDGSRIYSYGISWGGYLSYIYLAYSRRVKMGAVGYTTAYMHRIPMWIAKGLRPSYMGKELFAQWVDLFDAKNYIPEIKIPVILARGMEDACFPPNTVNATLDLFREGTVTMTNYREYVHGHINGSKIIDVNGRICDDAFGQSEQPCGYEYSLLYTLTSGEDPKKQWFSRTITEQEYGKECCSEWYSYSYEKKTPRGYTLSDRIFGADAELPPYKEN